MDEHIYELDDVPEDYKLGDAQQLQVRAHKQKQPIIDYDAVGETLSAYRYPLYFFVRRRGYDAGVRLTPHQQQSHRRSDGSVRSDREPTAFWPPWV